MSGAGTQRDVVFTFSYETYTDAAKRGMMRPPDRILHTLMESDEVGRLIVANPFRFLPTTLARRAAGREVPFPATPLRVLHTPMRMRRDDPLDIAGIEREYRAYDLELARLADELELVRPVVITTHPLVAGFSPFEWAEHVMFFARDDWTTSTRWKAQWPSFQEAYRRVAESGRSVTAVSQEIIDRIAPTGPHAVVPNGVTPEEWTGPAPDAPEWLQRIPGPRALHVGTLDDRLDVEGIVAVATAHPELQIVLMGPQPDPGYLASLAPFPNVHLHPSVGRRELVATMRNVELCLLAHRRTPLTEAMSPLKLYEYVASGCPVISVDLPPIHGISDRIRIVPTMAEFAGVVDEALADGPATEDERLAWIHANSWAARHTTVLDILLDRGGARSGLAVSSGGSTGA
ncbi:Glycosyltransferase involved in cell wall bisynthesis [Rathayibacter oskolensis]|uniref:Glycosyltransferase involved in cell wall bisynthesis n=1 Tax=Rathayibacter oskolensis TaxID=1891671 RepID=A0A1X7MUE1_9MICO|nr:glycosyltransferase [Rathayibacter oskolensis]SMH27747.1 Glycosyltransferase involved in cell wall bisynthesis [Rathayibacter oskolensis]